jgi:hypothetical protein
LNRTAASRLSQKKRQHDLDTLTYRTHFMKHIIVRALVYANGKLAAYEARLNPAATPFLVPNTTKRNDKEPQAWLKVVIEKMPTCSKNRIAKFLPFAAYRFGQSFDSPRQGPAVVRLRHSENRTLESRAKQYSLVGTLIPRVLGTAVCFGAEADGREPMIYRRVNRYTKTLLSFLTFVAISFLLDQITNPGSSDSTSDNFSASFHFFVWGSNSPHHAKTNDNRTEHNHNQKLLRIVRGYHQRSCSTALESATTSSNLSTSLFASQNSEFD